MQGLPPQLLALGILLEPAADLAIEIPAVEVERLGEGRHLGEAEAAQVEEAHHHVGELDAGVVDVVLNLDRVTQALERAAQDVAEHGVAQVADVGRLVGLMLVCSMTTLPWRTPPGAGARPAGRR